MLAALGLAAALVLLVADADARRGGLTTVAQVLAVAVLIAVLGPRSVRRALARAEPVTRLDAGSGEPTPLWHLPLVIAVLATPLVLVGRDDSVLRLLLGCAMVGLAQSLLLAALVARAERAGGRVFVRLPGSRILRGTRLGWWPAAEG